MIELLAKIFIKNRDNTKDLSVRRRYGTLCSIVGIGFNIILFVIKYLAGTLSGSISITADAFNNLSDTASSFITLMGFKFAEAGPDLQHPFGHGRFEYISGFIVSVAILIMGFELGKSSVGKICSPEAVEFSPLVLIILCISVLVKFYMFLYNRHIGKKLNSSGMQAAASDSISDAISTFVVLISTLVMHFFKINIDGYCGVLVAVFILYTGFTTARDTVGTLLGQPPSQELVNEIEKTVLSHSIILGIHDLIVNDYGPGRLIISLHGEVDGHGNIFEIHEEIDAIEKELAKKLGCTAVIHMDPIDTDNAMLPIIHHEIDDIVKSIDRRITVHDLRIVPGAIHSNIVFDAVLPYDFSISDTEFKSRTETLLQESHPNYYCVIQIDRSFVL